MRKGLGTPPQTSTSSGQQLAIHTKQTSDRIYSQIWVVRPQEALEDNYLVKPFPRGWECSGIRVDGKVVSFERTNNQLRIFYPAVFDAYYLEMWITPPKEWNDDVLRQMTPSDPEVDEIERAKVFIVDQSSEGLGGGAYQLLAEDERRRITPKELIDAELSGWLPLANLVDNNCPETTWRLTAQRVAALLWEQAEVDGYQFSVNEQDKVSSWIRLMGAFPWKDGRDFSASVLSARTRTFVSSPLTDAEISRASTLTWSNNISEEFLHLIPPVVLYSAYLFFAWRSRKLMVKKPWWQLLFLAAGWWFIAGDLWIPTIMAAIAAILVVDTYLLASEQFRQTGIRGPR